MQYRSTAVYGQTLHCFFSDQTVGGLHLDLEAEYIACVKRMKKRHIFQIAVH